MPSQTRRAQGIAGTVGVWTDAANILEGAEGTCATTSDDASELHLIFLDADTPFTIPAGATIVGIEMVVKFGGDGGDWCDTYVMDVEATMLGPINAGNPAAANCGATAEQPATGGATNRWGGVWSVGHINSEAFEVHVHYEAAAKSNTMYFDYVDTTVYYEFLSADLGAEFVVRQEGSQNLGAGFVVRRDGSQDLPAEFSILAIVDGSQELGASFDGQVSLNLAAELIVRHDDSQDLGASFVSRHPGSQDLAASFDGQVSLNLLAEFVVRQPASQELLGRFDVGQNQRELAAEFDVGRNQRELIAEFIVRTPVWTPRVDIGWETGDGSEWDAEATNNAVLSYPAFPGTHRYNYNGRIEITAQNGFGYWANIDAQNPQAGKFRIYIKLGHLPAVGNVIDFFRVYDSTGSQIASVRCYNDGGTYKWGYRVITGDGPAYSSFHSTERTGAVTGKWYEFELTVEMETSDGEANGAYSLRLFDSFLTDITKANVNTHFQSLRSGRPFARYDGATASFIVDYDDYAAWYKYIGPDERENLPAGFIVQQPGSQELGASFDGQVSLNLAAELIVRRDDSQDLGASFVSRHPGSQDLAAELIVRQAGSQDLAAEFVVQTAISSASQELPVEFIVRQPGSEELAAEFIVSLSGSEELAAEFIVSLSAGSEELAAEFIVSLSAGSEELPGEFIVRHARPLVISGSRETETNIFTSGFELATILTDWTGVVGAPSKVATPVHHGAASMWLNGLEFAYIDFTDTDELYAKWDLRFGTLPDTNESIRIGIIRGGNGGTDLLTLYYEDVAGTKQFRLYNHKKGTLIGTYVITLTLNRWYCIKIHFKADTDGTDGEGHFWLDSVLRASSVAEDYDLVEADRFYVGTDGYTNAQAFVDCVGLDSAQNPPCEGLFFWEAINSTAGSYRVDISDERTIVAFGASSLEIDLSAGGFRYIGFRHYYGADNLQDWSQDKLFHTYFYGRNSGRTWTYRIHTNTDGSVRFTYAIVDNFTGWKYFRVPFSSFNNVGGADWSTVWEIRVITDTGVAPAVVAGLNYLDATWLGPSEVLGRFIIRQPGSQEFPAEFIVRQPRSQDLPAEFIVRQSGSQDLAASFDAQVPLNLAAKLHVADAYSVTGITKDNAGNRLGNCEVSLFRTEPGTPPTYTFIASGMSDALGDYTFTGLTKRRFFVRAQKDGAPNIYDTTDNELEPV